MKFFKENNDKGKEIPTFPTGYGGVEAIKNSFESIHPGVCPLDFPSLLIHLFIIEPILLRFPSVSWIGAYIGNDSVGDEYASEVLPVKAGIKVAEKAVHGDIGVKQLAGNLIYPLVCLVEVGMIPGLGFGHGEGNALIVGKKEGIGRASFLPALIFSLFSSPIYRRMGTVNMGEGQIKPVFITAQNPGIYLLPFLFFTPFAVMVEDSLPARTLTAEKMPDREQAPLASALKFVEYCIYNLHKVKFGGISSFCYPKIGHYSVFIVSLSSTAYSGIGTVY